MTFNEEVLLQSNEIKKYAFLFQFIIASQAKQSHMFIIASQAKQSHMFVIASQAKQSRKNKYFFSYEIATLSSVARNDTSQVEIATLPSVARNDTSQVEINTLCSQ